MLFLNEPVLRVTTVTVILGVMLFIVHELYKATELLGSEPSEAIIEILETCIVVLYFFAVVRIFHLYYFRKLS
ncbi:MAG TPA: hypothetical protein HA257_04330 [Candidatus Methanoperedenaceae archaeon]|nr:hypothetical protein [Candidatus Methanoperedenaceae archaeon]